METMLTPIVRLTLYCGLGHSEFAAAARRVFIDVASAEYGVRGRPANIAKISAKTGLPRKAIQRHRTSATEQDWTPDDESSPLNTVIHYWRYDGRFNHRPGNARDLPYDGKESFTSLVKSCAGDIPVTTLRKELIREGIARQTSDGMMSLSRDYSFPDSLDEDFLRNAAFSIGHLGDTVFHNAVLVDTGQGSASGHVADGWFERIAWSRRLSQRSTDDFQQWVRNEGTDFVLKAEDFISQREGDGLDPQSENQKVSGVGVYFFRESD
jgi:hypothetical protein